MSDSLIAAGRVAASGLQAQSMRMRVISENIANQNTTGFAPGSNPYRRKTINFKNVVDNHGNARVEVGHIGVDRSHFILKYEPGHPAADKNGYVKYPNVNEVIEMADMREANRSYEANLQIMKQTRELMSQTINMLK